MGYNPGMGSPLGIRTADVVLIAAILVTAFAWWMHGISGPGTDASHVEIFRGSERFLTAPLSEDGTFAVPGPLGQSIVEIRSGRAFMRSSPCRDKVCIHMGGIEKAGQSIICIPNRVSVVVRSYGAGVDTVTY